MLIIWRLIKQSRQDLERARIMVQDDTKLILEKTQDHLQKHY